MIAGGAVVLFIAFPVAVYRVLAIRAAADLRGRLPKPMRPIRAGAYEQILEDQLAIPEERDSGLRVLRARALLPLGWMPKRPGLRGRTVFLEWGNWGDATNRRLDAIVMAWLNDELEKVRPALLVARACPNCRRADSGRPATGAGSRLLVTAWRCWTLAKCWPWMSYAEPKKATPKER